MYLPHYVMIAINLIVTIIFIPEEMASSCATYWLQIILTTRPFSLNSTYRDPINSSAAAWMIC